MEFFEGLFELPGALFRKFFIARSKSFDQILKDHTKNNVIGFFVIACILLIIIGIVIISI
jgi:hypothetical protein